LLIVWGTLVGFWVIWQMKSLYYDRKKELVSPEPNQDINPVVLTERCVDGVTTNHLTEVQAGCHILALPDSCSLLNVQRSIWRLLSGLHCGMPS
jgi:hypothetical protein